MQIVFLGMNPAGEKVYDWLNERNDVDVLALLTEKEQLSLIKEIEPELVVSSGFEHKVPADIIEVPEKGIVNLHPSYLPYNRGAHPYIWPIVEDTPAGVSIHYMSEEIDEGDIIARKEVHVRPDDTSRNLYDRLMFEQAELFRKNWEEIRSGVEGTPQNLSSGTVHTRNELEDIREIDMEEDFEARELIDRLRALSFSDNGNAYFERDGQKYYLELKITPEKDT